MFSSKVCVLRSKVCVFSSSSSVAVLSDLTEETVRLLPLEKVREGGALLAPGAQCRVCLRGFKAGQYVRKLPCQHRVCIVFISRLNLYFTVESP